MPVSSNYSAEPILGKNSPVGTAMDSCRIVSNRLVRLEPTSLAELSLPELEHLQDSIRHHPVRLCHARLLPAEPTADAESTSMHELGVPARRPERAGGG